MAFLDAAEETISGLLTEDTVTQFSGIFGPQWGIFLDGAPTVDANSVISFEYRKDFTISDYPVEQGGFESYDKVQLPGICKVRYAQGGSVADRQAFLASIEAIDNDTNLYDVVTPEVTYISFNIHHVDYRRTANQGMGLITVDVWLTEIRIANNFGLGIGTFASLFGGSTGTGSNPTLNASQVQNPSAADQFNSGIQQPGNPTSSQNLNYDADNQGTFS